LLSISTQSTFYLVFSEIPRGDVLPIPLNRRFFAQASELILAGTKSLSE
jgi:hypothetical protein